ncbi:hypothetical protein PENDEC_c034G01847 [Penicillium decumbens]|uniref:Uncharacterized protein n=1 Tax=Penicillium decumbens TaxID=69771 RepID=A0A1V6NUX6_PENDC|nr:hypothetical protein PENDEC_c034G01847 [Penicillium decumbens]
MELIASYKQRAEKLEGPEAPLIKAWERLTMEAMKRPTRPRILNWLLYRSGFERDIKTMRDFAMGIIKTRKENPEQSRNGPLDGLLNNTDPQIGKKLSETQVTNEVITMFIGATASPNLVSYSLYYPMKNPDNATKARVDIDSIVSPNEKIQLEHLKKMEYCEAIIRESLRLSATAL